MGLPPPPTPKPPSALMYRKETFNYRSPIGLQRTVHDLRYIKIRFREKPLFKESNLTWKGLLGSETKVCDTLNISGIMLLEACITSAARTV